MASINRGDNTRAFGGDFLRIHLNNPNNLIITKAVFQVNGDLEKVYYEPKFPLKVNFSGEETFDLQQMNVCKLALWDDSGRRRTAEGKFTFFVKENQIREEDSPFVDDDYVDDKARENEASIMFDLDDSDFAAQFVINATPTKMSELEQDIYMMSVDNIKGGNNVEIGYDDCGNVYINAQSEITMSYEDIPDKPNFAQVAYTGSYNDLSDTPEASNTPCADWNATSGSQQILNKPEFSDVAYSGQYSDLLGVPSSETIPTKLSELENDVGYIKTNVPNLENYYCKIEMDEMIPTTLSDLENDKDFITKETTELVNYYTADEVDAKIPTKTSDLENDSTFVITNVSNLPNYYNKDDMNTMIPTKLSELENDLVLEDYYTKTEMNEKIPTKTSELENDNNFVTASTTSLENYYNKVEVIEEIKAQTDLTSLQTDLTIAQQDIIKLTEDLITKADEEATSTLLDTKADLSYVETELTTLKTDKLDSNYLGAANLNILANGENVGIFNANAMKDVSIDLTIPTKVSDLDNDLSLITKDDIDLTVYATSQELEEGLAEKMDTISVGDGQLLIKVNESTVASFSANTAVNTIANITVPQYLTDLNNDSDFLIPTDLEPLQTQIDGLQETINLIPDSMTELQAEIDTKVTAESGKTLISSAELVKLNELENYDDTDIKELISDNTENITDLQTSLNTKVDKVDNKQLSTNDYTDTEKQLLETTSNSVTDMTSTLAQQSLSITNISTSITSLESQTEELTTNLTTETTNRQTEDNYLQTQIDALTAKSTVVDILGTYTDLQEYDTSKLKDGDVVCVIMDDTQNFTTTYYRWLNEAFSFIGSEGEYYTKAESAAKFALQSTTVNGKSLATDIVLTAADINALPSTTEIGDGRLTMQRNGEQIATFDANQVLNETFNVLVPEKVSELENDMEFVDDITLSNTASGLQGNIDTLETQIETNSSEINVLKQLLTGEVGGLPTVALTGSYNDLSDKPFIPENVSELENDSQFVTQTEMNAVVEELPKMEDIPVKVSELENDRGYLTTSAIGSGTLQINLQDKSLGTWMANESEDQEITIPLDDELSIESENPVQNKLVTMELNLKAKEAEVVHLTTVETISGDKTFTGSNSFTTVTTTTMTTEDNSLNVATTEFVKNQDYCTNDNAVHKIGTETISGDKTFTGSVELGETATAYTQITTDDSTKIATTEFVKNQDYSVNSTTVHTTGDETINGNKTFTASTTFVGITTLGSYAHVTTPDETDETGFSEDLVVNVEYVTDKISILSEQTDESMSTLQSNITSVSDNLTALSGTVTALDASTTASLAQVAETYYTKQDTYTKTEVDNLLATKQTEIDTLTSLITSLQQSYEALELRVVALEPVEPITYYGVATDAGILYFVTEIPEDGDTGIELYNSDKELVASDGVADIFVFQDEDYIRIISEESNLVVIRWNDTNDVTV